jgi:hypothetical protein
MVRALLRFSRRNKRMSYFVGVLVEETMVVPTWAPVASKITSRHGNGQAI